MNDEKNVKMVLVRDGEITVRDLPASIQKLKHVAIPDLPATRWSMDLATPSDSCISQTTYTKERIDLSAPSIRAFVSVWVADGSSIDDCDLADLLRFCFYVYAPEKYLVECQCSECDD